MGYELDEFVRHDLQMSRWDISNSDLLGFYEYLDRDGDGVDVDEFFTYVRSVHRDRSKLGAQNMSVPRTGPIFSRRKRKTYKEDLEERLVVKRQSMPSITLSSSFANLPRDSRPNSRASVSGGNTGLYNTSSSWGRPMTAWDL